MEQFLGLTRFLLNGDKATCSPILKSKFLTHFTIMKLIGESTLTLISDTRSKIFGNVIFEKKGITLSGHIFKYRLQFTTTDLQHFLNLVRICKDIEPRYERTRKRDFFLLD